MRWILASLVFLSGSATMLSGAKADGVELVGDEDEDFDEDELDVVPGDAASGGSDPSLSTVRVEDDKLEAAVDPREPTATVHELELDDETSLARVLERAPGVFVRRLGGLLAESEIQIRGASAQQVLVVVDGIRMSSLTTGHTDLASLPASSMATARILPSGGAAAWGSGAEGGVVELSLLRAPTQDGLEVGASARGGSWFSVESDARIGGRAGEWAASGGLSWRHSEGDFGYVDSQGSEATRLNNDGDRVGGHAAASWSDGTDEVGLLTLVSWSERGAPGPSEFPSSFREARSESLGIATGVHAESLGLATGDNWELDGRTAVSYRHGRSEYRNPSALLGGQATSSEAIEHALEPSLEAVLWAVDEVALRLILSTRHEWLERSLGGAPAPDEHRSTGALAALIDYTPHVGVTLFAAIRSELDNASEVLTWVPRVGLAFLVDDHASVRLNLGRAYRQPTFDELFLATEFVRGDPELAPEQATTADFTLTLAPAKAVTTTLSLFYSHYEDLILFVPRSAFYYQATNLSGAESRGVELSTTVTPVEWLEVDADYTFTAADFTRRPRDPLPARPEHVAGLRIRSQLGPVRLGSSLRFVGPRFLDASGGIEEEAVMWWDAQVRWDIDESWSLQVDGRNLLDNRGAVDALQQPLPGLALHGRVSWSYELGSEDETQ